MTELEKIAYAKTFIDKLENGINPIDDTQAPEGDVINNVRISRCFFFVSDILGRVIDNGGVEAAKNEKAQKPKKSAFSLTDEEIASFAFSASPITATEIADRIIAVGHKDGSKSFPKRKIAKWMIFLGFIEEITVGDKVVRRPTEAGEEIGLVIEERMGQYGAYTVILYTEEAQRFIIDNIEALLAFENKDYVKMRGIENQSKPWDKEDDEMLARLLTSGRGVSETASALRRTERSVITRARKMGIALA